MGVCRTYNNGLRILATVLALIATVANANAQSAALVANAKQQFFSATGAPLAGGFVYSYVPNTTVPKTTWSDQNEQFPNSQPVVLDSGGFAPPIFGQGNYRQIVQDANHNQIWDGFTSAYGSSQPSGANGTDTAPVGSVMPFSGFTIPTNWQLAFGQALSRTTFATLLAAITIQTTTGNCISTSTTVSGFASTAQIPVGSAIEASCLPTGTTVASIVNSSTITVSQAGTATGTFTVTDFPWGNGDGATTFNVPDLRGRTFAGADCLGSSLQSGAGCAGRLTSATNSGASANFGGTGAQVPGLAGGAQGHVLVQGNLPNVNFVFTQTGTSTIPGCQNGSGTCTSPGSVAALAINVSNISLPGPSASGNTPVTGNAASGGSGFALGTVQPTLTVNYIIKVAPNTTGGGGVTSFGGMFGDIVCASTLTCAPQANINTVGCTTATTSQLGCVEPDGTTVTISNGVITAHLTGGGVVSSVALALPASMFNVSGSPVTSTGTLTGTFANQSANTFFAGPTSGGATTPAWRALVSADIPTTLSGNYTFGGSITAASLTTVGTIGGSICMTSGGLMLYIASINCFAGSSVPSLAPGTTTISPTNNGYVLTDNSGVLAETQPTGTGLVVFSASPALTGNVTLGSSGSAGTLAFGNATSGTVKLQTVTGALGSAVASLPANTGTLAETNLTQSWTAAQTFTNSDIILLGSSTGGTTFTSANAGASNFTLTIPAATDTMELIGTNATVTGTRTYSAFATFNGGIAVSRLNCTTPSCSPTSAQYYICAVTSGGVIQVNLPGSPTANELHLIKDCTGNDQTNNITINANGSTIDGQTTYTMKTSTTGAANNKFDSVGVIFDSVNGWMLN